MPLIVNNISVGDILKLRGFWVGEVKWVACSVHGTLLMFDTPKMAYQAQSFEPICVDKTAIDMLDVASNRDILDELEKYRKLINDRIENTKSFFESIKMYGDIDTGNPVGFPVVLSRHVGVINWVRESFIGVKFCRTSASNRLDEVASLSSVLPASEFRVNSQLDVYNRIDNIALLKLYDFERRWLKNG